MSKTVKSVTKSVGSSIKAVTGGIGKVVSGRVGEGIGDITSTAAKVGLDTVTGGNAGKVDALTGGLVTTAENAARGNTKDIARLGVTAAATAYGGPTAGLAANQVFSGGGNVLQAGMASLSGSGLAPIASVAGNLIESALNMNGPSPVPSQNFAPTVNPSYSPQVGTTNNNTTLMAMGGGFLVLIVVLVLTMRKR